MIPYINITLISVLLHSSHQTSTTSWKTISSPREKKAIINEKSRTKAYKGVKRQNSDALTKTTGDHMLTIVKALRLSAKLKAL